MSRALEVLHCIVSKGMRTGLSSTMGRTTGERSNTGFLPFSTTSNLLPLLANMLFTRSLSLLLPLTLGLLHAASPAGASASSPYHIGPHHHQHQAMAYRRRKQASVTPNSVGGVGPNHSQITPKAASAPGVTNLLGRDEDPSPLTYYTEHGQQAYFIPTVDFGRHILFHNNTNLNKLYSVAPTVLYTFASSVGTEAADVMQWDSKNWLVTVSALEDDTMRSVSFSLSGLINGTSAHATSHGTIMDENGSKLYGYDSHVFKHPNGRIYLIYSNNISLRIAQMTSYNTVIQDTLLVQTYRNSQSSALYNTEAPSTLILPDSNGSQTINLAFATGSFRAKDYNTRLMYIDAKRNPLNANNWKLVTQPLIQMSTANKVYAPGSGGFFTGPDGTAWFAYGAYDRPQCQGGASGSYPRTIRAQKAPATSRGILVPITPISTPNRNP